MSEDLVAALRVMAPEQRIVQAVRELDRWDTVFQQSDEGGYEAWCSGCGTNLNLRPRPHGPDCLVVVVREALAEIDARHTAVTPAPETPA